MATDNIEFTELKQIVTQIFGAESQTISSFMSDDSAENPDPTLKAEKDKHGGLAIYDTMASHSQPGSSLAERINGVMSLSRVITPASSDDIDITAAEFIRENLIEKSIFNDLIRQLAKCLQYGFSVSEPIWDTGGSLWIPTEYRFRHPKRFLWGKENKEKPRELKITSLENPNGALVPPDRFAISIFGEAPWGRSIFSRAYWPWRISKEFIRQYSNYGAARAASFLMVYLKEDVSLSREQREELIQSMSKLKGGTVNLAPGAINKMETIGGGQTSIGDFYQKALEYFDGQIKHAIMQQTASSDDAGGGNLGGRQEGQLRTKVDLKEDDGKVIAVALSKLIEQVCILNLPGLSKYPQIELKPREVIDLKQKLEQVKTMVEVGVPLSIKQVRDLFEFDEPTDEKDILVKKEAQALIPMPQLEQRFAENILADDIKKPTGKQEKALQKYADRGKAVDTILMDTLKKRANKASEDIYQKIVDQYLDEVGRIESKYSNLNKQYEALKEYALPDSESAKLVSNYQTATMVTYLLGKYVAQNELKQTIRERVLKFAEFETDLFGNIDWAIVTPNSAIEAMRQVVEVTKAEGQMLSPLVEKHGIILGKGEADYIRGVWADTLQDAIKRGVPLKQFRDEISLAFDLAGITKVKPYHIEAIYRTNMSEAFVAGRMIEHDQNPMSREIFPALQYIAIVDERTRIDHAGMNNYVALRTDPIWQTWLPPNGWQCRCQVSFVDKWDIEDGYVKLETGERKLIGVPLSPDSGFAKGNQFYNTIRQVNKGTVVENYDILVKNAKKAILADYQKEAIHDYTGTRYAMLNKVILKNTIGFFPEMSELSLNLDSALNKLPEFNGVTYRGIKFGSIKESSEFLNKCLPGQSISFPSYTSTSIDKDIASKFLMTRTAKPGTRVLLEIRGKSGKVLNGWSWREIEKEILFGRGAKFNVVQLTTQENGINYLILEEI